MLREQIKQELEKQRLYIEGKTDRIYDIQENGTEPFGNALKLQSDLAGHKRTLLILKSILALVDKVGL